MFFNMMKASGNHMVFEIWIIPKIFKSRCLKKNFKLLKRLLSTKMELEKRKLKDSDETDITNLS